MLGQGKPCVEAQSVKIRIRNMAKNI